jgi:hypothetical protein
MIELTREEIYKAYCKRMGSGQDLQLLSETVRNYYTHLAEAIAPLLEANHQQWQEAQKEALHEAVLAEREACRKAVCGDCRHDYPVRLHKDKWWHTRPGPTTYAICRATFIRERGE